MDKGDQGLSRRRLLQAATIGLALAPLARWREARAAGGRLDENDATARELGYKADASRVDTARFPKRAGAEGAKQFCRNCQFFQGKANAASGPCSVFGGKEVSAGGWCNSWFRKTG
ncbi:MAG: high-potential iron-sulfur protein [Gammaproteobacteria bacterium]